MICSYSEHLNQALRDRFVCGPNNPKVLNNIELVNTGNLMFKMHAALLRPRKLADRNIEKFHPSRSQHIQVNKVMEQESKNTERLSCPTVVVGEVIQVSLLKFN